MFEDATDYIAGFPYYGDKKNYFPTISKQLSKDYGAITVDPQYK